MSVLLDAAGRRRSPVTMPGYHTGRPPANKGMRYPADPPTVDEIVAAMRHSPDDHHSWRIRAMIVVLWRAGLRVQEALSLVEHDLDPPVLSPPATTAGPRRAPAACTDRALPLAPPPASATTAARRRDLRSPEVVRSGGLDGGRETLAASGRSRWGGLSVALTAIDDACSPADSGVGGALPRTRPGSRPLSDVAVRSHPRPALRLRGAASAGDEGVGVVAGELVDVPWLVAGDVGDGGVDGFRLATRVVGVVLDQSVDLPR
jgi:hypothetical protein